MSYSALYSADIGVCIYKRCVGILLNGEFVLFLSRNFILRVYGIDIPKGYVYNPYGLNIRDLVKLEKKYRVKLNR